MVFFIFLILAAITSLVSVFCVIFRIINPCALLNEGSTKLDMLGLLPIVENVSSISSVFVVLSCVALDKR